MNRQALIAQALRSVQTQSLKPAQVLVIDDASSDNTVQVAEANGATVIALETNGGSGPARNRGIEAAQTEWIAFLDSDDTWHPDHLATLMERAGDHVLVAAPGRATGGRILGNASGHDHAVTSRTAIVPGNLICTSGTIVRRSTLLSAGLFRPLRRAQDLDMWVRVLEQGTGLTLGRPTFTYTLHDGQAIHDEELMRSCFGQILDYAQNRPWFSRADVDRAWARWHWDDLRRGQRTGDYSQVAREAAWLGTHPQAWRSLVGTLRQRRDSRSS